MVWGPKVVDADLLKILNLVAAVLSLSGSSYMIYSGLKVASPKPALLKLILTTAIADFIYSISNLMSTFQTESTVDTMCYIEAGVRACSFVMSVFYVTCISVLCYKSLMPRNTFNQNLFFRRVLILGFIICCYLITL